MYAKAQSPPLLTKTQSSSASILDTPLDNTFPLLCQSETTVQHNFKTGCGVLVVLLHIFTHAVEMLFSSCGQVCQALKEALMIGCSRTYDSLMNTINADIGGAPIRQLRSLSVCG